MIPTLFELRLPLSELLNYINRQVGKSFSAGDLHWEFVNPKLDLKGNRIGLTIELQLTGLRGAGRELVRATVTAEILYQLKDADLAVNQPMVFEINLVSLRYNGSGMSKTVVESNLTALLRSTVFDKTTVIYPFRVSDEPVKALLEHVTMHDVTFTDFNQSIVVRGTCHPVRRSPNRVANEK